ncbi:MAG: DUF2855 family protein [Rhodoferax sp.]|uniref:DUF2855 family protein n=1 Tax=Rhodoferax sp. TaxID=50421 RepID=UPI002724B900|nr:DUF2855 family protein [Rhodoferax sp.]MDO8448149.1 DUF2855 family protein [Rhodoferax sp.]
MTTLDFLVRKDQLATTELRWTQDLPLSDGEIRLRIDKFALTSNNITYAAFGDAMNYWSFFPASPSDDGNWGRIPVWGFGTVMQSLHPGVAVGEKLYGYYPMSSSVVLKPARLSPAGFSDGAAHRASLHPVYNQYLRCSADPFYTADTEDTQALLRPLFITSWLIDDFLADNDFFGAVVAGGQPALMLLSSASSKTAYGTAFQLAQRAGIDVVGLTSAANVGFCESLGCYHRVLTYDQLDQLDAAAACLYVDFAGNADLRRAIHSRFANLKYSSSIGGTHVDQLGGAKDLPGPRATLFFAPAQIKKRNSDWGAEGLGQRLVQAWQAFVAKVSDPAGAWLVVEQHQGPVAVEEAYRQVLGGRGDPRRGHMLSLSSGQGNR